MWSEHCSYKSSKVHLRQLAPAEPASAALLAGIGHNAGVVDIGQGYAVTFKIESHNHPSYVEPHQGAATGAISLVLAVLGGVRTSVDKVVDDVDNVADDVATNVLLAMPGVVRASG
jgi:hypothetical protein